MMIFLPVRLDASFLLCFVNCLPRQLGAERGEKLVCNTQVRMTVLDPTTRQGNNTQ
jgi:hypothetical protein